ncbi:hypothetical protein DVH24_031364 [Malus domestica]|uniref:Serine aminopeptidase S33 domain-containing protein n=1 Tax=Malus domestica TaxID=3750 RepID=A0A498HIS7_MALDO|nr:hypothetical protein DVH24_031364 [Malus domestica]
MPNSQISTQSSLPLDQKVKATVFMTHDYGSDTGWLFQNICINYTTWGYAVFVVDLLDHGRSDGINCYLDDMEKVVATSFSYFLHVRQSEPYLCLPAFLFGESLDGLATMLMYIQSPPDMWTGLIFSSPLFWAAMPNNNMVGKAIKDPVKLKIIVSNPRRYMGPPRVGTVRETTRMCKYVQDNFSRVMVPFLTVHRTADGVTCPTSSQLLYEKGSSPDKTLKMYNRCTIC